MLSLFLASSAHAQPRAEVPVPQGAPVPAQNMPATAPANAANVPPGALPLPTVDDPMLAPVPPPPRVVATWQEALDLVRARSTDLRTAYDEVIKASAQQRIALAQVLPGINGNLSASHQVGLSLGGVSLGTAATDSFSASAQLQQTLINVQQFYALGTAKKSIRAAELSVDDLKRTLALAAANAIVGVVTAERVAEINRVGLQQALARLDLTVRKQRLGAATGLDVVRAQQDVENARTTLVSGDETLRKNREALGLALGLPTQVGVPRDLKIDALEADATRVCRVAPSVEERSDIQAQRQRVTVAERQINDVWWQFLPQLNAQGSANDGHSDTSGVGGRDIRTWSIQAVLSVPIWDGGARYGLLRQARANADEASQTLEANRRQASIQIEQARRAVTVANDTLAVQARARDLAVKNDELTQAAYREGTLTSLDLVTAAAARRQAEIQYALDEFNLVQARVAAILALANCDW